MHFSWGHGGCFNAYSLFVYPQPYQYRPTGEHMTKLSTRVALVTLATLGVAAPARAQFDYYCVMGSFQVCASVRLASSAVKHFDQASGKWSYALTMDVWNLNGTLGVQHTMTAIGMYHAGTTYDWSARINSYNVDYNGTDITSFWTNKGAQSINNLAGVKLELKEGTQGNAGIIGCKDPGGSLDKWKTCVPDGTASSFDGQPYVRFTFNLSEQFVLNNVELRWHSQQLPDGSSTKCDTGGAGDYPVCEPPTVVPEPATLVLLGTGMVGVFGAARRRRSKRNAIVSG